jgi:glycosyltransferase involved in cell wall biosynthesis
MLGVLLCYNDGDLLEEALRSLLEQDHHVIVWDHGSTDQTPEILRQFKRELLEIRVIPREFDFYELYPAMSRHLMENYTSRYDWVSWPDQDEFLEGPSRVMSYQEALLQVFHSEYNWIRFRNFNFWATSADDPQIPSTIARVRHYSLFPDCAPRIRSWRSSATNVRRFNHNPALGEQWPVLFNLRHYPMRSREQMMKRVLQDRAGLLRDGNNYHYENMAQRLDALNIEPQQLHRDDGQRELNPEPAFNWRTIYGHEAPRSVKADPTNGNTISVPPPDREMTAEHFVSPASSWIPDRFVLSAWLEHAPFAFWLMDALRPQVLVELGTHTGYSYLAFAQAVKQMSLTTRCFAVDTWTGDEHAGAYGEEVFNALRDYHDRHYSSFSELQRTTFDEAVKYFQNGSIDLLHIDGRHFYEDVKHDFVSWRPKLSERSIVLFHDIGVRRRQFGVCFLWEELRRQYPYFEFVHCQGLGVLGCGKNQAEPLARLFAANADASLALQIREMYSKLGARLTDLARQQGAAMPVGDPAAPALAEQADEIARLKEQLASRSEEVQYLRQELSMFQERPRQAPSPRVPSDISSTGPGLSAMLSRLQQHRRARREMQVISDSGFFDEQWYLQNNPDVVASGIKPVEHYFRFGASEGRDPGPNFQTNWYRTSNPDVERVGMNPLLHYIRFGRAEGRIPNPPAMPVAEHNAAPTIISATPDVVRVVFISGNPQAVGHRYRVLNIAESLPEFCQATIVSADDLPQRLHEFGNHQLTWIWRAPWSDSIAEVVNLSRRRGAPVVFDIDDLLIRPELATLHTIDGLRFMGMSETELQSLAGRLRSVLSAADHFTTTSSPLVREATTLSKPATLIPNGYEQGRLEHSIASRREWKKQSDGLVRIGYLSGTLTHQRDLAVASRAVANILAEFPHVRLVMPSFGVKLEEFPELQAHIEQIEWRERVGRDETPSEYARFDINLAPLELGNPFCEAKSELKYVEAALVAVPTVASPTEPYATAIRHGETGFLAANGEQWHNTLLELVENANLRKRVGESAFNHVLLYYGPEQRRSMVRTLVGNLLGASAGPAISGRES